MKPEERAAVVTEFKCHLFDDFVISLDEVFREWFQYAWETPGLCPGVFSAGTLTALLRRYTNRSA